MSQPRAATAKLLDVVENGLRLMGRGLARLFGSRRDAISISRSGWQRLADKDWRGAVLIGELAVAADPTWADGYRILGAAYRGSGELEKAVEVLQGGMKMIPSDYRIPMLIGDIFLEDDSYREAGKYYRIASEIDRNNIEILNKIAQSSLGDGRKEEAEIVAYEALSIDSTNYLSLLIIGQIYLSKNDFLKAEEVIRKSIHFRPENALAHYDLALALAGLERWDEARVEAQRATKLDLDHPDLQRLTQMIESRLQQESLKNCVTDTSTS